jgi:nucleoside-diphosphate-sugar epimerase
MKVLVAGGGGFIGGYLVRSLLADGVEVRAVDHKPLEAWHQRHIDAENVVADLSLREVAHAAAAGCEQVYNLACDMGGIGFLQHNRARCMLSVLINTQLLVAARDHGVERYFFASSACVYPQSRQAEPHVIGLRETDAYPADPEDGYGWEKLFSERMCRHFSEDFCVDTRVGRFHNVYGPHGTWNGGREKAPAAICRKIAHAKLTGVHEIEVWGDGRQTRSFLFVDDCIEGTRRLMASDVRVPVNIGSSESVSIEDTIALVEAIAGISVVRHHDLSTPQGVRGRNSDNTFVFEELGWEPTTPLAEGLARTYEWIEQQVARTDGSESLEAAGHAVDLRDPTD